MKNLKLNKRIKKPRVRNKVEEEVQEVKQRSTNTTELLEASNINSNTSETSEVYEDKFTQKTTNLMNKKLHEYQK